MSDPTPQVPRYCLHRASGQAVVRLSGRDHYLGKFDSPESRARYDRLIAEWLASLRHLPQPEPVAANTLTVNEVFLAYWEFAQSYYRKNGQPTSEVSGIKLAMRDCLELYGSTSAMAFGPLALKAVRQKMIERNLCRGVINHDIGRIKRMFKWATENELIPPSVLQGLQAVAGLRRGRSEVRETAPVRPVPEAHVTTTLPCVARPVAAMIRLQVLTGMRSSEVTRLRACDLDTTGRVWIFTPCSHKTEHHGIQRSIFLGPQAQAVIQPFLKRELTAFLFSPLEAQAERLAAKHAARTTPLSCGNRPGTHRRLQPRKQPGDHYNTDSYRRAIAYACKKASVLRWHPHQLRHNAATFLRKQYGLDAARVILGHSSPVVTEVYAELDHAKAMQIMGEVG